jgi:molybdopterin-guanine dinucleotide biosynthesis protein A
VSHPYDAVVLAGGAGRRLGGGTDKPAVRVGARTLLDRVLAACPDAARTVVVGPPRRTARPVRHVREDPPGGGPVAALAAGLGPVTAPLVVVLAADLPFLTPAAVHRLRDALAADPAADGVLYRDAGGTGRDQPLTAAYRTAALRRRLAAVAAEDGGGDLTGLPLRLVTAGLTLRRLPADGALDCDTWADIGTARARIRDHGTVLDEWIAAVAAELGVDPDVDTKTLLDAARDAAHAVARPAAPLTTFLVGYAAALHGMSPADAARRVSALAEAWAREEQPPGQAAAEQRDDRP